jgi:type II secretory pathway pseudopilin PulG
MNSFRACGHTRLFKATPNGFSLAETVVVVLILAVSAAVILPTSVSVLRRERVNALALELAGWLEEVRALSARQVTSDAKKNEAGCSITISAPSDSVKPGDDIAAAANCNARNPKVSVPRDLNANLKVAHSVPTALIQDSDDDNCAVLVCTKSVTVNFTPRGMWSFSNTAGVVQDLEIRIALADGRGPKRCVRMSSILGSIDIGSGDDGNTSSTCERWGQI